MRDPRSQQAASQLSSPPPADAVPLFLYPEASLGKRFLNVIIDTKRPPYVVMSSDTPMRPSNPDASQPIKNA